MLNIGRKLVNIFKKLVLILAIITVSCNSAPKSDKDQQQHSLTSVSLKEQIGAMLMIGFRGADMDSSEHIERDLKDYHIGGVVLYSVDLPSGRKLSRNIQSPTQLKALNQDLQRTTQTTLLIGIDQEGGIVSRLTPKRGFPPRVPSAQYLGTLNNLDSTRHYARLTAQLLKDMGINFNFAPVVDVNVNPACPVIGGIERSYSDKAQLVGQHAQAVIEAQREAGILSSLKHFPGHGSAKTDSHLGFTDVTDTWTEMELIPYIYLIDTGAVDVIMTAHVFNAQLDSVYPATLSRHTTYRILREQLGFEGVIISDDLHMGAVADNFDLATTIEQTLNAGVDILMFSNNSPKAYDPNIAPKASAIIQQLVAEGKISAARIHESYQRITALKASLP